MPYDVLYQSNDGVCAERGLSPQAALERGRELVKSGRPAALVDESGRQVALTMLEYIVQFGPQTK